MGEILTPTQLAERYQISLSWVYRQMRHNPDWLIRISRGQRIDLDKFQAWLEAGQGTTPPQPHQKEG